MLVVLQYPEGGDDLIRRISRPSKSGLDENDDLRMLGVGSQILHDIGVRKMRVLGSPRRVYGLSGFDLEIVDYLPAPNGAE